jgi:hypothetical protein
MSCVGVVSVLEPQPTSEITATLSATQTAALFMREKKQGKKILAIN